MLLSHYMGAEGRGTACSIPAQHCLHLPGIGMLMDLVRLAAILVLPNGVCWGILVPHTRPGRCPSLLGLQEMLQIRSAKSGVQRGGGFILKIKGVQPEPRRGTQQGDGDYKGN